MEILTSNSDSVGPGSASQPASPTWQKQLKNAIRDLSQLCAALDVPVPGRLAHDATTQFPVFVPAPYLARIRRGDPNDPLLRQVLPLEAETLEVPGFVADPLSEIRSTDSPEILFKYPGRALLVTSGACAIHCRYCFRRHFPYDSTPNSIDQWQGAIAKIEADPSIEEVILSGGDPLTLVDSRLTEWFAHLQKIPHVSRLRIHSRLPIVIPDRVTDTLLKQLAETRFKVILVVHVNHAQEIDRPVKQALARLIQAGAMLFNQSVLLRGVNDNLTALVNLSRSLIDCGVTPYYLHQLDRVDGAAHFEVPVDEGRRLVEQMRARLPGYAVPTYVQEVPGVPNKSVL